MKMLFAPAMKHSAWQLSDMLSRPADNRTMLAGMVIRADVLAASIDSVVEAHDARPRLLMSPRGKPLTQDMVRGFAKSDGVVIICGRFEGVDERVIEGRALQEISIGDYVLSGGELAAAVLVDAIGRLKPDLVVADISLKESSGLELMRNIKAQYPKDSLYVIGFSAYARELKPQELPYVRWDESVLGTNMHHALLLAERLLAKHRGGSRQILMISDGEPTAHLERGRSQFSYPPSPVTIRETLKAVKRVTQQDITINTFMLDRNYYLKEFVNQLAKINGGRVFYTTPDKLGEYILVDYVQNKRSRLSGR